MESQPTTPTCTKLVLLPLDELHTRLRALCREPVRHLPVRVQAPELQLLMISNVEDSL